MDAAELRAMQAPIKDRYKKDPNAAMKSRLKAKGAIENEGSPARSRRPRAGRRRPASGDRRTGLELCSGDMLLEALVACAGVTLNAVATALEIPLEIRLSRGGRSRFSRHAGVARRRRWAFPQSACASMSTPSAAGKARSAPQADRTLLRGLPDHQERPEGLADDAGFGARLRRFFFLGGGGGGGKGNLAFRA